MLKNVAEKQLVLVSTGAGDWLESNGSTTKTAGGYLVSAHKHFASQCVVGDMLVTSAAFMRRSCLSAISGGKKPRSRMCPL